MLPQRLLQSLAVRLVPANHRHPLLVLLLVEDPQEVTQLGDGERVPLGGEGQEKYYSSFQIGNSKNSSYFVFN